MLVKGKKDPEVCFLSKDMSGFYAKFVLGLPLRSKSYHKPVNEANNC